MFPIFGKHSQRLQKSFAHRTKKLIWGSFSTKCIFPQNRQLTSMERIFTLQGWASLRGGLWCTWAETYNEVRYIGHLLAMFYRSCYGFTVTSKNRICVTINPISSICITVSQSSLNPSFFVYQFVPIIAYNYVHLGSSSPNTCVKQPGLPKINSARSCRLVTKAFRGGSC